MTMYTLKDSTQDLWKYPEEIEEINNELYLTLGKGNFTPIPNIYTSNEIFLNDYNNADDKKSFLEQLNWMLEFAEKENEENKINLIKNKLLSLYSVNNSNKFKPMNTSSQKFNKNVNNDLTIKMSDKIVTENIEKHDTLNPLLFDENDELKPDIKEAIIKIVNQFIEDLAADGVKFSLRDIILVGSNVSYNYTKDSDLDIHIVADSESLDCNPEVYTLLYGAYRSLFNKNYDITIKGIPVEIYVELG